MRILHVIHSIDPRSGGPSHALRQLVSEQVRRGHRVSLLTTDVQSAEPWEPRDLFRQTMFHDAAFDGVGLHIVRAYGRRRPWSRYAYSPEAKRWLRARLRDQRNAPEVVHIHGIFSHITAIAASLSQVHSIPYLIRTAGSLDAKCVDLRNRRLKRLCSRLWIRRHLDNAARVHATSEAEAVELKHWVTAGRVTVIPHGVTISTRDRSEHKALFLKAFPALRGQRVVLYMGRLHPIKRTDWLVHSLAELGDNTKRTVVFMAGHDVGGLDAVIRAARDRGVADRVILPGFLSGRVKSATLASADVFALPSIHENFGLAVVEAMAHGTPVVVTSGVASHVYVDQSGGGLTVADTPQAVADGIRTVLNGDGKAMGQRGKVYVEKHLTWSAVADQLDDLYRTVSLAVSRNTPAVYAFAQR